MRAARVLVAVIAGTALALPPVAAAQGTPNPLSPGLPQPSVSLPTTTTPTVTATSTSSGSSGFSGSSAIVIAIGALIVLGGISLFIWRDARRRAPARHRAAAAATAGRAGSKQRVKPRKLSPAERRRRKRGRAR